MCVRGGTKHLPVRTLLGSRRIAWQHRWLRGVQAPHRTLPISLVAARTYPGIEKPPLHIHLDRIRPDVHHALQRLLPRMTTPRRVLHEEFKEYRDLPQARHQRVDAPHAAEPGSAVNAIQRYVKCMFCSPAAALLRLVQTVGRNVGRAFAHGGGDPLRVNLPQALSADPMPCIEHHRKGQCAMRIAQFSQ